MKNIDRLLLVLIIAMLAVVATIDTTGNQHLEDTIEKTDIIAQCLDPDSTCAKFREEAEKRDREYFEKLLKVTNICVAHANRETNDLPIEDLGQAYDRCVAAGSPPPPAPVTNGEVKEK